ncbi:MAG: alpha/beta fold hydrolase [Pseudorhodoplanes sp.]|uniref:alpha/beta fold hydrolase n=1 Tax=Pseudorhodoplanes sp. TaxID=1934341 RepID=UPI003D11F19F
MPKIPVNGVELFYEEAGTGRPLIFVHGYASDFRRNEPQLRYFSRRYRTVSFSMRGYEPSDTPKDVSKYGFDIVVEDLKGLLDALKIDKAHICGFSMGGEISLSFGMKYPDRVHSLAFAAAGYGSGKPRQTWLAALDKLADDYDREGMNGPRGQSYTESWAQTKRKDPRAWAEWKSRYHQYSAVGMANTARATSKQRPDIMTLGDRLKTLDIPTLIILGDEDEPAFEASFYMKKMMPRAGLEVFPRTGHPISLEEPDRFNSSLLDFLTAVDTDNWYPVRSAS